MGNKYLAENESIQGVMLKDKSFILTKTNGLDYKASYNVLLLQIEKDMIYNQFLRDVGEDFKIILHNKNRDEPKIKDDMFEYVLCNGQEGIKSEYPEYCNKFDISSESFKFPDIKDGYLVNNPIGSGISNGTYLLDSIKSHVHNMEHDHDINHDHDMSHQHTYTTRNGSGGESKNSSHVWGGYRAEWTGNGRDRTGESSIDRSGESSRAHTEAVGELETAGRRTTVQIYIKAKFLG